ncbi:alpha/beta fold hydrolase [Nocardia sp. NPDC127579]|uniref:alpha/beta fold hydrolase n=1 Tax=Nocardia sp. NPDC127579 TaxID=3345402 RepID=UPI00362FDFB0
MSRRSTLRKFLRLGHSGEPRQLGYRTSGTGEPLLLLHPIGLDGSWWSTYIELFSERFRVIAVDLPGHGASSPVRGPITLDGMARDVAAVLEAEKAGPAHVVGVSMGGMVAQHLALRQPRKVASMILCATAGSFADDVRPLLRERGMAARAGMAAVIEPTLERWFPPRARAAAVGQDCARTLAAADPGSWAACWAAIAELATLDRLGALDIPALVITGSADITTAPTAAEALARALPDARLVIVPGAWHMGVFEDPKRFVAAFADFLERNSGDYGAVVPAREPPFVVLSDK